MDRFLDYLLSNLWWPFLGGVLISGLCLATAWAIGKLHGRRR